LSEEQVQVFFFLVYTITTRPSHLFAFPKWLKTPQKRAYKQNNIPFAGGIGHIPPVHQQQQLRLNKQVWNLCALFSKYGAFFLGV
jgi:hypothetical protein